jgi:hypothetical protein
MARGRVLLVLLLGILGALLLSSSASAAWHTHSLDGLHLTDDAVLEAKPGMGGFASVEVDSNETGDRGGWELIVRNHLGQVVFDGPCVSGTEDGREDRAGLVLGSNIRVYGARRYEFHLLGCGTDPANYHITEVRLVTTVRTLLAPLSGGDSPFVSAAVACESLGGTFSLGGEGGSGGPVETPLWTCVAPVDSGILFSALIGPCLDLPGVNTIVATAFGPGNARARCWGPAV